MGIDINSTECSSRNTFANFSIKGLDESVNIYRDFYGIPHVLAKTINDAFWGQGFVTAQDRLWHMDLDRKSAYGKSAEYLGLKAIEKDKLMRKFGIQDAVKKEYSSLNAKTKLMLESYSEGVNAFIIKSEVLPVEYQIIQEKPDTWTPLDCLAVFKGRHIMMGAFESKLWRARLLEVLGPEKTNVLFPEHGLGNRQIIESTETRYTSDNKLEILIEASKNLTSWSSELDAGSNNWVLTGAKTKSGKPLLAGDPHRALDTPNVYYQNHIACDQFDVIGLSFPGCPGFPHFGHNKKVAWCVTHAQADYQDIYLERMRLNDSSGRYQYRSNGQWIDLEIKEEEIKVKNTSPIFIKTMKTDNGPIIIDDIENGNGFSFKYSGLTGVNHTIQSICGMLFSNSIKELDDSMDDWISPCQNFLFADVNGDVGYLMRGKMPKRKMENAWVPVPGWNDEFEWNGYIPFDKMPRKRNPVEGYIATANNRIVGKDHPFYVGLFFSSDHRINRIINRIESLKDASIEDMADIHTDIVSIPSADCIDMISMIETRDELQIKAKGIVTDWNRLMAGEAVGASIYSAFRLKFNINIVKLLFGKLSDEALDANGRGAPFHIRLLTDWIIRNRKESEVEELIGFVEMQDIVHSSFVEGLEYLKNLMGTDVETWQWARIHKTSHRHELSAEYPDQRWLLDPLSVAMSGDGDTPLSASYSLSGPFTVTGASVARYIFDLADWDNSKWITPLGSSGNPLSAHYLDQNPIWAKNKMIGMQYSWNTIFADAKVKQTISSQS